MLEPRVRPYRLAIKHSLDYSSDEEEDVGFTRKRFKGLQLDCSTAVQEGEQADTGCSGEEGARESVVNQNTDGKRPRQEELYTTRAASVLSNMAMEFEGS